MYYQKKTMIPLLKQDKEIPTIKRTTDTTTIQIFTPPSKQ